MVQHRIELDARSDKIIRDVLGLAARKAQLVTASMTASPGEPATADAAAWNGEMSSALDLMLAAYGVQRSTEIGSYRKQAAEAIERAGRLLVRFPDTDQGKALHRLHDDISDLAVGKDNVFAARNEVLGLQQSVGGMLARNKLISDQFGSAVSGVFDSIRHDLDAQTANYHDLIRANRQVLIGATVGALAFALLAFFYISRRVIQRIVGLRDSMLANADNVATPIDVRGRDEIGEMARALQFFVSALQRREEALRDALDQQFATTEVLQVINNSPGNMTPVFETVLEKAARLCDVDSGILWVYDGTRFHAAASHAVPQAYRDYVRDSAEPPVFADLRRGGDVVHVADLADSDLYRVGNPLRRAVVDLRRARTGLNIAIRKNEGLLGVINVCREQVRPFTEPQIARLTGLATQAAIAIENARLLTETREARDAAEHALSDLKTAQASLIQAEKMASLGQLTAGIAHEIKNPLNFVNNFAALSNELLAELKEIAAPALDALGEDKRKEVDETIGMLSGNLDRISEHGQRADNIVKSMLEHSRGVTGERREIDLNGLVDEALNLAYHGARARDPSFNITLERDFDTALAPIELVPQDMTRVLLNLFGNGFYAAIKRQRERGGTGYKPVLKVATCELGDAVEIQVLDNGTGIAPEITDKLFQPFFTTKPTGEGTGLGLSISYDIVTQQHGGTITVDSRFGEFTEFTIILPRRSHPTPAISRTRPLPILSGP
jgi:signal transduction histidine kinase/HAMP domain-containing protein